MKHHTKGISVIMPTYNQSSFILAALNSLFIQTFHNWELLIINDGCTDDTERIVEKNLRRPSVKYIKNEKNIGLGACLNIGLDLASFDLIAYLPSDDLYYKDHLETLYNKLENSNAILALSGMVYGHSENINKSSGTKSFGLNDGVPLQLVQVLHRKTADRWMERNEGVTSSLKFMFWDMLKEHGDFIATEHVSCEWVNHPQQRHKIINETSGGGIYRYKQYYQVDEALSYMGAGNLIDEQSLIEELAPVVVRREEIPLRILLVGELSFNPERIIALEEKGHKLYGLWISAANFFTSVGPFPFGNIKNVTRGNWIEEVNEIKPDIIYALLNHHAIVFAYEVMLKFPHIPFVWHFKESPTYSKQMGTWDKLINLYRKSDGQIYLNQEAKDWYDQYLNTQLKPSMLLDGDLPKKDWFKEDISIKLSDKDGAIHTVLPGRPWGLQPENVAVLADHNVHLHFYGDFHQRIWQTWLKQANELAHGFLHIRNNCAAPDWVKEFSQYDAGWLHVFNAENYGERTRVTWQELNIPARMPTLAAAGLPMIHKNNASHISATQSILMRFNIGVFFDTFEDLCEKLKEKEKILTIQKNVWEKRMNFCFDFHVEKLLDFFRVVIRSKIG